ncbi:hypothetical protein [Rubellicoccus peritrichatus]|uniref:PEP-CTERM protein-sorting domain-containing protein n=1 Tax=Rubellicoccus peritrichatus TaxID=3080537 RepID=A0AAQ3QRY1_9BACT|nr:hypothetical protein [Puniceicoccus sp. CR14]WOO39751.1 hypothetical protein RZN69_14095 [Puniceicoccus sp. CR14]
MKIRKYTTLAALLLFVATYSHAQFFAYDGFETPGDYTDATDVTAQSGGGSGDWDTVTLPNWNSINAGGTFETVTSSLTYTAGSDTLLTTTGSLDKSVGGNTIVDRDFNTTPFISTFSNTSTDLWFSLLVAAESTTDTSFRLTRDSAANGPSFEILNGNLRAQFNNDFSSNSVPLTDGTTYFLLGRVRQDAGAGGEDILDMWVNPDLDSAPIAAGDLTVEKGYDITIISRVQIQSRNNDSFHFDELRIGDSFSDVAPTVIPEPSVYVFAVGFSAIGLLVRRLRFFAK